MATRYWRGGSGTWDTSSTTNWSATFSGPVGASAPTAADDVIIDGNSGLNSGSTITLAAVLEMASYTNSTSPNQWTFSGLSTWKIYGSISVSDATNMVAAAISFEFLGVGSFNIGLQTLTYKSITIGNLAGTSIYTVGSSFNADDFIFQGGSITILNKGISATNGFTFTGSGGTWNGQGSSFSSTTNPPIKYLATGNWVNPNQGIPGSGQSDTWTFNSVTGTTVTLDAGLFGTAGTSLGIVQLGNNSNTTTVNLPNGLRCERWQQFNGVPSTLFIVNINGTLLTTGNPCYYGIGGAHNKRTLYRSYYPGTTATLSTTVGTSGSISYTNFANINNIGGTSSGTSIGNCGGNTGLTFTTAKTVYLVAGTGGAWATGILFSTSSGGSTLNANFPLPQDTCVVDTNSLSAAGTMTIGGTVVMPKLSVTRTTAWNFNFNAATYWYNTNLNLNTGCTLSGSSNIYFGETAGSTVTISGNSFTSGTTIPFILEGKSASVFQLTRAFTCGSAWDLNGGTLDFNGYALTCKTMNLAPNSYSATLAGAPTLGLNYTTAGSGLTVNNTAGGDAITAVYAKNLTITGTQNNSITNSSNVVVVARGQISPHSTEANALSISYSGATSSGGSLQCFYSLKNITLTGTGSTTFDFSGINNIYGNVSIASTMAVTNAGTSNITFAGSGTQTINFGLLANSNLSSFSFSGTGSYDVVAPGISTSGSCTLNSGTLIPSSGLSCSSLIIAGSGTKTLNLSTNGITLTGTATTVLNTSSATNLTFTGANAITTSGTSTSGTRTFINTSASVSTTNCPLLNINSGTDTCLITGSYKGMTFTGGTPAITFGAGGASCYGNFTVSSACTFPASAGSLTMDSVTATTITLNSNATTLNFNLNIACTDTAGVVSFANTSTTFGSASGITLTSGNLAASTASTVVTCGNFVSTSGLVRGITNTNITRFSLSAGNWNVTPTNLTFTGTPSVTLTGSSVTQNFIGGGKTYGTLTLNGTNLVCILSNDNTFNTITSGTNVNTLTLTSGSSQAVSTFSFSGSPGNQATLNSTIVGSYATLSDATGTNAVTYLTIQDNLGTGGATWDNSGVGNSVISNVTGWTNSIANTASFGMLAFLM